MMRYDFMLQAVLLKNKENIESNIECLVILKP